MILDVVCADILFIFQHHLTHSSHLPMQEKSHKTRPNEVVTYQVKYGRLYHRFLLAHNEINGGLMKHLLALQETAWLVFLLEKAMNLITITISDKPTFHLILHTHSRSNDDNPHLRTMHIIHSS